VSRSDSTDTGPDNIRNGDTVDHASRVIPVTLVIPVHVTASVGSHAAVIPIGVMLVWRINFKEAGGGIIEITIRVVIYIA
jgi:hypothetical protein